MNSSALTVARAFCSFFFAGSLTLDRAFYFSPQYTGVADDRFPANFPFSLTWTDFVVFLILFVVSWALLGLFKKALEKIGFDERHATKSDNEEPLSCFGFIKKNTLWFFVIQASLLLCWLLVYLNYFPGTSMNDQIAIINSPVVYGNNHPLLYNLALSGCVYLGDVLFGSHSIGFALFVIIQMLVCSTIIAFCALWLKYRTVPKSVVILVVLFFCISPIISNYAISSLKDTLFAYMILLWLPFLFEAIKSPRRFWQKRSTLVVLFFLITTTCLIRNNGIYVVFVLMVIVILMFRKTALLRIVAVSALGIVVAFLPNLYLASLGTQQLFRESIGIPLQQMAAVTVLHPETLTEEQVGIMDGMLPIEEYSKTYSPQFVDEIKYAPEFDTMFLQENRDAFIQTYVDLGLKHPDIYFRAYLAQTHGYWSLLSQNERQSYFFAIGDNGVNEGDMRLLVDWKLVNNSLYPDAISDTFDRIYRALVWAPGSGLLFFLILLLAYALALLQKNPRILLIVGPYVLLWGTLMVATPLANSLRYALAFVIAIPFFIGLLFANNVDTPDRSEEVSDKSASVCNQ